MAYNKLHKKDFSIAIKTGGNALDEQKFAKEAAKGELFFNSNDNKLYIATTDAGLTDATLKEVQLSNYAAPFVNGYSIDLDGNSDYVSGNATTTIGSVSMWFKSPDTFSNTSVGTTGLTVLLGQAGSDYVFGLGGDTVGTIANEVVTIDAGTERYAACSATNQLVSNTWHHLFAAWQTSSETVPGAAGYDFWINGVKATNAGNAGWSTGNSNVTSGQSADSLANGFRVGCRASGTYFYDGLIDEFAVWAGDVSGDVANIYNSGNGAVDLNDTSVAGTAPNIWWRMGDNDSGSGSTITNQGSNGSSSDGTLNGTAAFSSDVPS